MILIKNHKARIGKTVVKTSPSSPSSPSSSLRLDSVANEGDTIPMTKKLCYVCNTRASLYCCRHCFSYYCSVPCYQQHGLACTEAFYRQKVKGVLDFEKAADNNASQSNQRHMNTSSHESQREGDDYIDRILLKLEENDCDFSKLTEEEMGLLKDASSADITSLSQVTLWKPWWEELVVELGDADSNPSSVADCNIGSLRWIQALVAFQSLKKVPSIAALLLQQHPRFHKNLVYQYLGIVFGYVVTMKRYNGEWEHGSLVEALVSSSPFVEKCFQPTNVKDCILLIAEYSQRSDEALTNASIYLLLQDCIKILESNDKLVYSLLQMWVVGSASIDVCNMSASLQSLAELYTPIFREKPTLQRSKVSDSFCRKVFYIMLAMMEEQHHGLMNQLVLELKATVQEYG